MHLLPSPHVTAAGPAQALVTTPTADPRHTPGRALLSEWWQALGPEGQEQPGVLSTVTSPGGHLPMMTSSEGQPIHSDQPWRPAHLQ